MLTIATLISITCKIDTSEVLNASTFKSGMSAWCAYWAWRGSVIPSSHIDIQTVAGACCTIPVAAGCGAVLCRHPALLQAAHHHADACGTDAGSTPDGDTPWQAVSLFVLPTYPTCWQRLRWMTGSTRIGKYVFNHAFLIPGVVAITPLRHSRLYHRRRCAVNARSCKNS
jgi:anaerobic C4-dicarboxylate transporter DcuA